MKKSRTLKNGDDQKKKIMIIIDQKYDHFHS